MKKRIYKLMILAVLFQACDSMSESQSDTESVDSLSTVDSLADPAHSSRNALSWIGTYEGILPCEDCDELQARITLEEKGRYSRKLVYKGKSNTPLLSQGKFVWNDAGTMVTLQSFKGNHQVFQVGEEKLIFQNPEGDSEKYVLQKVKEEAEV